MKKFSTLAFHKTIKKPPTYPLHPVKTNNASPIRLTATAGTTFCRDCLLSKLCHYHFNRKGFTGRPFIPHKTFRG